MRKKGGRGWLRHRRGKRGNVERGLNLTKGGTHSELTHRAGFESNDSPLSLYRYMATKAAIAFRLIAAGGCRQWLNNLERKHWTTRHETPFGGGFAAELSLWVLRDWKPYPIEAKVNIDLTPTTSQVGRPISDRCRASLLVEEKGVFRVSLIVHRWKRCGKAELSSSKQIDAAQHRYSLQNYHV